MGPADQHGYQSSQHGSRLRKRGGGKRRLGADAGWQYQEDERGRVQGGAQGGQVSKAISARCSGLRSLCVSVRRNTLAWNELQAVSGGRLLSGPDDRVTSAALSR